jgi:hypothetical protein
MRPVARSLVACIAMMSLVGGALVAPMTHVHAERSGHGAHHGAVVHSHAAIHVHVQPREHHEPSIGDTDHDDGSARALNFFQAVGRWTSSVVGMPVDRATVPLPTTRLITPRRLAQHGHDPPVGRDGPSRAPPSPLS